MDAKAAGNPDHAQMFLMRLHFSYAPIEYDTTAFVTGSLCCGHSKSKGTEHHVGRSPNRRIASRSSTSIRRRSALACELRR